MQNGLFSLNSIAASSLTKVSEAKINRFTIAKKKMEQWAVARVQWNNLNYYLFLMTLEFENRINNLIKRNNSVD